MLDTDVIDENVTCDKAFCKKAIYDHCYDCKFDFCKECSESHDCNIINSSTFDGQETSFESYCPSDVHYSEPSSSVNLTVYPPQTDNYTGRMWPTAIGRLSWPTFMADFYDRLVWPTFMADFHGRLSWPTFMADFCGRHWSANCGRFWPTGRPTFSAKSIWPADLNFKVGHQP